MEAGGWRRRAVGSRQAMKKGACVRMRGDSFSRLATSCYIPTLLLRCEVRPSVRAAFGCSSNQCIHCTCGVSARLSQESLTFNTIQLQMIHRNDCNCKDEVALVISHIHKEDILIRVRGSV